jgi:hypothetical protein
MAIVIFSILHETPLQEESIVVSQKVAETVSARHCFATSGEIYRIHAHIKDST